MDRCGPDENNADEVKAFLKACAGDRLEALFRLGVVAAMRPGDLFALRRTDLDLDGLNVDVRRKLEDDGGKLAIVDAKADSARRIPISAATAEVLRRHLAAMDAEKHRAPYAFVTERGKWLRKRARQPSVEGDRRGSGTRFDHAL